MILIVWSGHKFAHVTTTELCKITIWSDKLYSCKSHMHAYKICIISLQNVCEIGRIQGIARQDIDQICTE